ncbi:MAG: hypothetical protein CM1200mP18_11450 [Gammaproteobacteria bacterium]|nr:MAG: hypothetical protein CM1200mP18_11450 [Gammaproteobacteria bacterium]
MPIEITPLNAPLGACVRGKRLKGDINPNDFQIIQQALLDHHLSCSRIKTLRKPNK